MWLGLGAALCVGVGGGGGTRLFGLRRRSATERRGTHRSGSVGLGIDQGLFRLFGSQMSLSPSTGPGA